MQRLKNIQIKGCKEKPILLDITYQKTGKAKPIIIFTHGFKGFKDWGHFNLIAQKFAENNFVFVKYNISYNGTTPENPTEFLDLEAFGHNNYSIEADDLGLVIDYIEKGRSEIEAEELDLSQIFLMGHSRGGGATIVKAAEDARVKKIVTLASINNYTRNWSDYFLETWKKRNVIHIVNGRTRQEMPLYWQLVADYQANESRLNIENAVRKLNIPFLVVHGTDDPAVPYKTALAIKEWNEKVQLLTIENGNHVFGGKHPYTESTLPTDTLKVVEAAILFLNK